MKTIACIILAVVATGCQSVTESVTSEKLAPGGIVMERKVTKLTARSLFDSRQAVDKIRLSNTDKTQSIGMSGVDLETSGTNAVQSLTILNDILGKVIK